MNTIKYKYSAILLFLVLVTSCKKAIELVPKQSIPSENALETMQDIEAGTFGIYAILRDVNLYGRDLLAVSEALADNTFHTNIGGLRDVYNNNNGAHLDVWQAGFTGVNRANLVLEAIENIEASQSWKDAWAGQVHFLRALLYFNMATVYGYDPTAIIPANDRGAIPLYEKGIIDIDDLVLINRASVSDTYNFLYEELDSAYVKLSRSSLSNGPHRVTPAAVSALYSRVALFNGDYSSVINNVNVALNLTSATFQSKESYVGSWRNESHPESIFEVKFNTNENVGANNSLRATYMSRAFITDQIPSTHGTLVVGDALMALYEASDIRRGLIMKGLGNNINRNEMTKFSSRGGVKDLDNVPVIRISELYLNRAEAYYRSGNETLALSDLNKIRVRAGLTESTATGSALYEDILLQRRLEFAFEGHRWFDLKRLGRNVVKSGYTLQASDYRILARIPFREINSSEGMLRQNRGY